MIKIIIKPVSPSPIVLEVMEDPNFSRFDIFQYEDVKYEVRSIELRILTDAVILEIPTLMWSTKTYNVFPI